MTDDSKSSSRWAPLSATGSVLGVLLLTILGWLTGPTDLFHIPAKPATAIVGALLGIAGVWARWSYQLWKHDSKRERIRDAIDKGRMICHCTESGEIMTQHHALGHRIDLYACPVCENFEIVYPKGSVAIADNTEFRPHLPLTVRQRWLRESQAGRR